MMPIHRALSGIALGLVLAPLSASAGSAPVTRSVLRQGARTTAAIETRLKELNAPASVLAIPARIQSASKLPLMRAESAGENVRVDSDPTQISVSAGHADYHAIRMPRLLKVEGSQGKGSSFISISGKPGSAEIVTQSTHAIAPKTTAAWHARMRWITPGASPGTFHVKSLVDTYAGVVGSSKQREYDITVK